MIRATRAQEGVSFDGDVPDGMSAYVDADWIPAGPEGASVPSLIVGLGEMRFVAAGSAVQQTTRVSVPDDADADALAAAALTSVAQSAAAVAATSRLAEVTGEGFIAAEVRRLLGARTAPAGEDQRPDAIVELTGDPEAIAAAFTRVVDLGLVVLAGEPAGRSAPVDLYTDVHGRGLHVTGVGRPLTGIPGEFAQATPASPPPARARPGKPAARATWYRVDSATP